MIIWRIVDALIRCSGPAGHAKPGPCEAGAGERKPAITGPNGWTRRKRRPPRFRGYLAFYGRRIARPTAPGVPLVPPGADGDEAILLAVISLLLFASLPVTQGFQTQDLCTIPLVRGDFNVKSLMPYVTGSVHQEDAGAFGGNAVVIKAR